MYFTIDIIVIIYKDVGPKASPTRGSSPVRGSSRLPETLAGPFVWVMEGEGKR